MNKIVLIALCSYLIIGCHSYSNTKNSQSSQTKFQTYKYSNEEIIKWSNNQIDSIIRAENIPALSIGIIKNGKVIMDKGFGVHNRNNKTQASSSSIYQIASDTKKMTGIIVKNLVAKGKLKLDEPVITYLGNSIESKAKERLQNITLRQLLLHKSGLPYRQPTMTRKDGEPMLIPYTEKDLLNDLNNVKLKSEPGTTFEYSNFGYAVIGYICERAAKKSYSELIEKYISKAYQMPNTTTLLTDKQLQLLVTPYRKEGRNTETKAFNMGKLEAAGGVYSNIEDLSRLMLHQINSYVKYNQSNKSDNLLYLNEDNITEENGYGYGLGKKKFETGSQYGHGGDLDGFASSYLFSPEYKSGVIILTSSGGKWVGELEKKVFYKLTNRTYSPPKKSIAQELYNIISKKGFDEGKIWFEQNKNSNKFYIKEAEINNVGYALIESKINDAIEIFKWNTVLFPKSANAYDSLGEAYFKNGNKELAIKNYEISIRLNPENINAKNIIKQIKTDRKN